MPFKGDILSESKREWSRICAGLCRRRKTMTRKGELVEEFVMVDDGRGYHMTYRSELAFQCRRFEVNQHHVADVMLVLLKSVQSASREEAVEEMKDCRRDEGLSKR
ncbi:hypothetical protein F2Q68_00033734 [Brassica cretica]|uniref:Uncharacterized protein n=1 Tax=Brassica cretica TaxID=69181 RepID=A0A8S9H5H0_BRACR|nr:hypothetical protein F2Q68_00033734 [Brassica cretica]